MRSISGCISGSCKKWRKSQFYCKLILGQTCYPTALVDWRYMEDHWTSFFLWVIIQFAEKIFKFINIVRNRDYLFEVDTSCCHLFYLLWSANYVSTSKVKFLKFGFTPLLQVRDSVEYSQICLTSPHTLCYRPKPWTSYSVNAVVFMFKCYFFKLYTYLADSCYCSINKWVFS